MRCPGQGKYCSPSFDAASGPGIRLLAISLTATRAPGGVNARTHRHLRLLARAPGLVEPTTLDRTFLDALCQKAPFAPSFDSGNLRPGGSERAPP
jgi:hypothetical protein